MAKFNKNISLCIMLIALPCFIRSEHNDDQSLSTLIKQFNQQAKEYKKIDRPNDDEYIFKQLMTLHSMSIHKDRFKAALEVLSSKEIADFRDNLCKHAQAFHNHTWGAEDYNDLELLRDRSHHENEYSKHLNAASCWDDLAINKGKHINGEEFDLNEALEQDRTTSIQMMLDAYMACLSKTQDGRLDMKKRARALRLQNSQNK